MDSTKILQWMQFTRERQYHQGNHVTIAEESTDTDMTTVLPVPQCVIHVGKWK